MYREPTIPVYVQDILQETPVVKRFTLAPLEGHRLPPFSAGSHITTYVQGEQGVFDRNYSLTNHPDHHATYHIAIRLSDDSKGGSEYWHQHIKQGDQLEISYPKNHFQLSFKAKHHVFYAAGIGITPFLSMMAELQENGASFELHYAAKSKEYCAFYSFLTEQYPEQVHFYFSNAEDGRSGRMDPKSLLERPIGTHTYFCGPEAMINDFTMAALNYGYPTGSIHFERFTPPGNKNRKAFQAMLANSCRNITVLQEQTLLEALLQNDIKVPYSCRVGRCGTCELKVVEGQVDHHDDILTEDQKKSNKLILSCVSRAASDKIVLDL